MTSIDLLLLGGGGHSLVVLDVLETHTVSYRIKALVQQKSDRLAHCFPSIEQVSLDDEIYLQKNPPSVAVNGVGLIGNSTLLRKKIYDRFRASSWNFLNLIDQSAKISASTRLGNGAQVFAGAVIQSHAVIGNNCVVNTGALIDHECHLNDHAMVSPGAVLCGNVTLGVGSVVGPGAVILPEISIPDGVVIPANKRITKREAKLL